MGPNRPSALSDHTALCWWILSRDHNTPLSANCSCSFWLQNLQKPVTDGSSISSTTPGLTPERKTSSSTSPSSASLSSQSEKTTKKVRCRLSEASYSIPNLINTELINGMFHSDLRFDISPPVIQCLARLILKLDPGLCSHERNTLSDNNVLFTSWTKIGPLSVYHIITAYKWCYPGVVTGAKHFKGYWSCWGRNAEQRCKHFLDYLASVSFNLKF